MPGSLSATTTKDAHLFTHTQENTATALTARISRPDTEIARPWSGHKFRNNQKNVGEFNPKTWNIENNPAGAFIHIYLETVQIMYLFLRHALSSSLTTKSLKGCIKNEEFLN